MRPVDVGASIWCDRAACADFVRLHLMPFHISIDQRRSLRLAVRGEMENRKGFVGRKTGSLFCFGNVIWRNVDDNEKSNNQWQAGSCKN